MKILSWKARYGQFETWTTKPHDCFFPKQVHGVDIWDVKQSFPNSPPEADALICESPESPQNIFAIQTADCVPVLIEGERGWVLMHLGWRGLAQKLAQNPRVQKLQVSHIWIGPHIGVNSYEVSEDFTKNFPISDNFTRAQGKLYFNMQQELIDQVQSFAPDIQIRNSSLCTFHHQELHSHRANGTKKRNWTILKPF